ncbi:MAG TPA: phenylalanine--tRNA ligase subunit alpha, partial [Patescibacteria group bacterium]|nr:phenylalanine--tRNA ligase subunit alpha [Patescibacteria group bacterium]
FDEQAETVQSRFFDPTLPGLSINRGTAHPVTQFLERAVEIFSRMGFEVVEERETDTEEYNFDLLNIPKDHPSRDMHDTFYINSKLRTQSSKLLLRTQTSTAQIRAMTRLDSTESKRETRKPPVRIISPGRVFRHEATDASHETTFHQIEGFVVDKGVSIAHLIGTVQAFFSQMYGADSRAGAKIKTRIRPHFFPFVEPGMEIDMSCVFCGQKGCSVCKHSGWIEMLGSGMIHPTVLKNMGVDPKKYSGFAFGFGIDRMVMLYYGINDIRLLYSGDLRFLRQF